VDPKKGAFRVLFPAQKQAISPQKPRITIASGTGGSSVTSGWKSAGAVTGHKDPVPGFG